MSTKRSINEDDIAHLRELIKGTDAELVTPAEEEAYASSVRRWSRAAEKPAGACLVPKSAHAISLALKYASEHNIDIAVRGGGHSTAGTSSTDGGLLIDLNTRMRTTSVDAKKKTIKVGGGAIWGDVDAALEPYGLATVGGTVADTGVGGLTFGGGFGWLTAKHGLVVDSLLECTIVLADGRVVTASESENEDLFWGLRDAGQNFGVGIELVFRAYEQGKMWAGVMIFPPVPEIITGVIDASNEIFTPGPDGQSQAAGRASSGLAFVAPPEAGGQTMFMAIIVFDGPEEEGKHLFKEVINMQPVASTMAMVSYAEANKTLAPAAGARFSIKGSSFELPIRAEFVMEVLPVYSKFIADVPDAKGSAVMWELLDAGKIVEVPNSAMAFANRGRHFNSAVTPLWWDKENDTVCRQWSRNVAKMFKDELERGGARTGESTDGWIGKRGEHGATMVYGNYDRR
ncbi:FAD-binding domain-containing protein [Phaeosphaeriaceae sp. SRC1lsM3a]|nr:FAD-binding domain-containing protein [Stagonospora sp. SRC1lsM3a]